MRLTEAALEWTRWISFPTNRGYQYEVQKPNHSLKATFSHFTRLGQILPSEPDALLKIHNVLGCISSPNCPQLKALIIKTDERVQRGRYTCIYTCSCDCTFFNLKTLGDRGGGGGDKTAFFSLMLNMTCCLGSLHFMVSAHNTRCFPTYCNQNLKSKRANQ